MRTFRSKTGWLLLAAATVAAPFARSQGVAQSLSSGSGGGEFAPDGFNVYSVSIYGAYSSRTVPFGSSNLLGGVLPEPGVNPGPNYLTGIVASAGWRKTGARTMAYITYTPSYDASIRYTAANSMNHFLTFGLIHDLGPRWTFTAGGTGFTARWDQFLFEPTVLSSLTAVPASFDDFAQGILQGKYTNSQLASILTGAPGLESPASTLLYGTRLLSANLRAGLTYQKSARLNFHGTVGGTRMQHLNEGGANTAGIFLLPETTSAYANLGVGYSASASTELSFETTSTRMFSRYEDTYISTGMAVISHTLGRRWIAQARGGAGTVVPLRHTFAYSPGANYLAGGMLTFKTSSNMFMGSVDRTITDSYGLGARSASVASGAWNWHLPGHSWSVYSTGRYEMLGNLGNHNVNAWLASIGISRKLFAHTMGRLGYVYGRDSGFYSGTVTNLALEGVQVVISWSPQEPIGF